MRVEKPLLSRLGALPYKAPLVLLLALLGSAGCGGGSEVRNEPPKVQPPGASSLPANSQRTRLPAVAGLFYPAEERVLARTIDGLLESTPAHPIARLRGLVCPHAGYAYSGSTAAVGYKALVGREIQTVIVLGPSHYAAFEGACIPDADFYQTSLGTVRISGKAKQLSAVAPFFRERPCPVQRPPWWRQAPKVAPAEGQDTPETWEHSVEVQVPFLQRVLKDFQILPIIVGETNPEEIAKALAGIVDDKTIVVASSDLSHYHSYDEAKGLDNQCIKAMGEVNPKEMEKQEACGKLPILALMHLAKLKGWKAEVLDSRNSGDVTGEKERVVGYSSVAFYSPEEENFGAQDRKFMLELARKTLSLVATNGTLPEVAAKQLAPKLLEKRGCFVTLTEGGTLRGCIGHILPQEPLYRAVMENARSAAMRDPRFAPVRPDEVQKIKIEISVLTEPKPLQFNSPEELLEKLQPHRDGVMLRIGLSVATFLPQVWAQIPDKVDFLNTLSRKAGCEASAWRGKEVSVSIYHVEAFEEAEETLRY